MGHTDEFPHLRPLGLYAANIVGDGNCLFNALSDQLYGSQERHREIRLRVVDWMRDHKDDFTPFLDVLPGGATRRNPKRKNAGGYASFTAEMPSPEEVDRAFEDRLKRMAQGGTYGDNMEIAAFTSAYEVDVMVVQSDERYYISGPRIPREKQICCIAYHMWEHYSSVRNVDGPHTGPPDLKLSDLTVEELASMKTPAGPINVPQWQIDVVMKSLWFPIDEFTAIRALEDSRGNLDDAVSRLMDDNESPDRSSSVHSSSVEPQLDPSIATDDNFTTAPNKKQDRRMSRASKSASRTRERRQREALYEKLSSSSLEQLEQATASSVGSSQPRRRASRVILEDEDTDMDEITPPPPLYDGSTSSESDYSITTSPPKPLTLKLSLKPPDPSSSHNPSPLPPPSLKPVHRQIPQKKRLNSKSDKERLKKQAQKQAAKERRQAAAKPEKDQATISFPPSNSSQSSVNSGFRLLHV